MERAARLLTRNKYSNQILSEVDIARAVWPLVVGKAIAAHTSRISLVRSTLVVEVEDGVWQKQLHALTSQIVERLQKITGNDNVRDLEFRIAIPRRPAQRAQSSNSSAVGDTATPADEADRIADPVLKRIYRLSRKRALG